MAFWGPLLGGAFSAIGSLFGANKQASSAAQDRAYQKEFAQNGVQWRAEDAKKAGIHPLAALGASVTGYQPVGDGGAGNTIAAGLSSLGDGVSKAATAKLQERAVLSEIAVNDAQAELYKAQSRTSLAQAAELMRGSTRGVGYGAGPNTGVRAFGYDVKTNKGFSDAEAYETRYGDVAQELGGLITLIGDAYENLAPHAKRAYDALVRRLEGYRNEKGGTPLVIDIKPKGT